MLQPKSKEELVTFIREKADDCAVLIYCSSDLRDDIKRSVVSSMEVTVETDASELRGLDKRDELRMHKVLIAIDSQVMRGFDYRSPTKPICLILAKGFESQRDAEQALSRVGRHGDRCERLLTAGVELVDAGRSIYFYQRLIDFRSTFGR